MKKVEPKKLTVKGGKPKLSKAKRKGATRTYLDTEGGEQPNEAAQIRANRIIANTKRRSAGDWSKEKEAAHMKSSGYTSMPKPKLNPKKVERAMEIAKSDVGAAIRRANRRKKRS